MERKTKSPVRLDAWLRDQYPSLSGRQLVEAVEQGLVLGPKGQKLKKGARVGAAPSTELLEAHLTKLRAGNAGLEVSIVAEADELVVVDKPAGMRGHPLSLFDFDTVCHWALHKFPRTAKEFPAAQPTLTPHRLDTGTSGTLLVALTSEAYETWRGRFRRKEIAKKYLAWCWGEPSEPSYVVDEPLGHQPGDRRKMKAVGPGDRVEGPLLTAHTEISVEKRIAERGIFLASIACRTGVTHQIRVHLASLGFPLVGDSLYDPAFTTRSLRPEFHCLRATELLWSDRRFTVPHEVFRGAFASR